MIALVLIAAYDSRVQTAVKGRVWVWITIFSLIFRSLFKVFLSC